MNIVKWDPFSELEEMQRQLFGGAGGSSFAVPTMDVYEKDGKEIIVETHVPSFDKDEIDVQVHEGTLEIRADHRESDEEKEGKKYLLRESASSFYRRIRLPKNIDESKVDASFDDGMLRVSIPYKELPAPQKVQIKGKDKKK